MQIAPRPVHAVRRQVRDLRQVPHYLRELIIEGLSLLEDKGNQVSDSSVHKLSAEGHLQYRNQASNACVLQSWPIRLRNGNPSHYDNHYSWLSVASLQLLFQA